MPTFKPKVWTRFDWEPPEQQEFPINQDEPIWRGHRYWPCEFDWNNNHLQKDISEDGMQNLLSDSISQGQSDITDPQENNRIHTHFDTTSDCRFESMKRLISSIYLITYPNGQMIQDATSFINLYNNHHDTTSFKAPKLIEFIGHGDYKYNY